MKLSEKLKKRYDVWNGSETRDDEFTVMKDMISDAVHSENRVISLIASWNKELEKLWDQRDFCSEHNFNLEAEKFNSMRELLRRKIYELENTVNGIV